MKALPTISIKRGDSRTFRLYIKKVTSNQPQPLTWATVHFTVRAEGSLSENDDSQAFIHKVITTHEDDDAGITDVPILSSDTAAVGEYLYDVQVNKGSDVLSSKTGIFIVEQDVTKS